MIDKKKKAYTKPEITQHVVDESISMFMSSAADPGDGEPEVPWLTNSDVNRSKKVMYHEETNVFSSESSPFGGSAF